MSSTNGERQPATDWAEADYKSMRNRAIALVEFRRNHEGEHADNVATKLWVTHRMLAVAGFGASIVATLVVGLLRVLVP